MSRLPRPTGTLPEEHVRIAPSGKARIRECKKLEVAQRSVGAALELVITESSEDRPASFGHWTTGVFVVAGPR